MPDAHPSPDGPANLADYRLMRALRAGQPGAFASFWNAHAGPIWSVLRACCATDAEAIGWTIALRMDLEEGAARLAPTAALPPQIGAALLLHAVRERQVAYDTTGGPDADPRPTRYGADAVEAVARLSRSARLLYLTDVYFDLPDAVVRDAGPQAEGALTALRRALDPDDEDARDDARGSLSAALYRAPPTDVLLLPPGAEPPPPRPWWPRLLVVTIVVAAAIGAWTISRVAVPTTERLAREHAASVRQPALRESDPVRLGLQLARANVPGVLSEAPDLSGAGFLLLGADIGADAVNLVYEAQTGGTITLQHHLRAPRFGGTPARTHMAASGRLDAYPLPDDLHAVAWPERDTTWVLIGSAPPDTLLSQAEQVQKMRGEAMLH